MEKNSAAGGEDQNASVGSPSEKTAEERPLEETTTAATPAKKAAPTDSTADDQSTPIAASSDASIPDSTATAGSPDAASTAIPPISSGITKNPAAVSLGRLGGLKGGKARAEALTKRERSEAARKAARARWRKKEKA
ncbi:MAG: hypothetical protein WAU88_07100 [Candidatus Zixiibacteriota bacterium]